MPSFALRVAQFIAGDWTTSSTKKNSTSTRLTVVEELEAAAINNDLDRSRRNNHKRKSWKPSKWFGKKHQSAAMPSISAPTLQSWSGASTSGVYIDEPAALSSFLLVDRDRFQQIEADKKNQKKRHVSMHNVSTQYQIGVPERHELPAQEEIADEHTGELIPSIVSPFSNPVSEIDNYILPVNDAHEPLVSPTSPRTDNLESNYIPKTGMVAAPPPTPSHLVAPIVDSSLYDGSSWGPVSPRQVQSQTFPDNVQRALQERLMNNTRNRLSLPVSLRYGASNLASHSASPNPFEAEFSMTLTPAPSDSPFADSYTTLSSPTTPSASKLHAPADPIASPPLDELLESETPGLHRSSTYVYTVLGDHENLAERANLEIMTKAELVGKPFALPYRSHSTMFGASRDRPVSVRHRRGVQGRLVVDISGQGPVVIDTTEGGEYFRYPLQSGECWVDQVGSIV